jgi:hypothetical protein
MEKDREVIKLVNVLRRIARATRYIEWNNVPEDAARFCVAQYNKVLKRLRELEPAIVTLFTELPDSATPRVISIAAHELSAYFSDEQPEHRRHRRHCGVRVGVGAVRTHGCW